MGLVLALVLLASPSGLELAQSINARDEGTFVSRTLQMDLIDKRNNKRTRKIRSFRKYFGPEKRTVLFYLEPRNLRDTAFLTWDHAEPDREDDQWLYLPGLRKVRRISASDRGDYFLGTDLTFEDIKLETKLGLADYTYEVVDQTDCCHVLEATPVDESTARELGYSRLRLLVDSEIRIVRKAEYWNLAGEPKKTVEIQDIRQVDGIWTPHIVDVHNHENGHRSIFTFSDVDYTTPIDDDLFTERALRRGWR